MTSNTTKLDEFKQRFLRILTEEFSTLPDRIAAGMPEEHKDTLRRTAKEAIEQKLAEFAEKHSIKKGITNDGDNISAND